jgi:NAD(P)H-flavin reductase
MISGEFPMLPKQYVVSKNIQETHDTNTLTLSPFSGDKKSEDPFHFFPGQFNMLYVFGKGEAPVSISSKSTISTQVVHTIRSVGSVTEALCASKKGDMIGVRGPFGKGFSIEKAFGKDFVAITGGIGLAPMRPLIDELTSHRSNIGKAALVYGARHPRDLLFYSQLQKWRSSFDFQVLVAVDHADNEWRGSIGVVTQLIKRVNFDPENCIVYICGPEMMMKYSVQELMRLGVNEDFIYVSMERNMKCAIGLCGHCQHGPHFVCKDGPVFNYSTLKPIFDIREI